MGKALEIRKSKLSEMHDVQMTNYCMLSNSYHGNFCMAIVYVKQHCKRIQLHKDTVNQESSSLSGDN